MTNIVFRKYVKADITACAELITSERILDSLVIENHDEILFRRTITR